MHQHVPSSSVSPMPAHPAGSRASTCPLSCHKPGLQCSSSQSTGNKWGWASLAARHLTQKRCNSASDYALSLQNLHAPSNVNWLQQELTFPWGDRQSSDLRFSRHDWSFQVLDLKCFEDAPFQKFILCEGSGPSSPFQKNSSAKFYLSTLIPGLLQGIGECNKRKDGCAYRNSAAALTHQKNK